MTTGIGRNVRVEIATTFGTAKTVTAVTLASPGVATSTAHAMTNGTLGYWTVSAGMVQLDGQATRVYNQSVNAFDLQGLNTTNFSAFTAGTFTPATAFGTLAEAIGYNIGGGLELSNRELTERVLAAMGATWDSVQPVEDRKGHDRRYSVDDSRLRDMGYAPQHHFDDGLAETVAWYRDNETWWRPLKPAAAL